MHPFEDLVVADDGVGIHWFGQSTFALRTDFILLTHNHGDHTCPESIDRIRAIYPEVRFVAPAESAAALRACGVDPSAINTVEAGDAAVIGTMTAHVVYAKPPDGDPDNQIDPPDVRAAGPSHYSCFVTRDYDPREWATHVSDAGTEPLIIPYNQSIVYHAGS